MILVLRIKFFLDNTIDLHSDTTWKKIARNLLKNRFLYLIKNLYVHILLLETLNSNEIKPIIVFSCASHKLKSIKKKLLMNLFLSKL